jgi:uncharacterized protein (TIGR03086 family)
MLKQEAASPAGPVELYRAATERASTVVRAIAPDQLDRPTPCTEWTVQDLLDHLTGGTEYLRAAVDGRPPVPLGDAGPADFEAGVRAVLAGLERPGVLDRTCPSPLGPAWSVRQAVAGTFMDVLVHTWDLARACGRPEALDPVLVRACVEMFLPDMPEHGRAAGLVGPVVDVGPQASPQDRLLGAMGRRP